MPTATAEAESAAIPAQTPGNNVINNVTKPVEIDINIFAAEGEDEDEEESETVVSTFQTEFERERLSASS